MDTLVLKHANAMPAPTWHRLRANDTDVTLPQLPAAQAAQVQAPRAMQAKADAFDEALAALASRKETARNQPDVQAERSGNTEVSDETALSACQQEAFESRYLEPADTFSTGMGDEAREYLEFVAGNPVALVTQPNERACISVRVEGVDGAANAAAINVVAAPGSHVTVDIAVASPRQGTGVVGTLLHVLACAGARVDINSMQTLDDGWIALDDAGFALDSRASVNLRQTVLGAGRSYTGAAADVHGDDARVNVDTRYLGRGKQTRDFNYIVHQRGHRTACSLDAKGVLAGASQKTLRGTIDFAHGCKESCGSEQETVLLTDDRAESRTVPVILCGEDDVAGNHGATIGHVQPEQLLYLASRGISPEAAEQLFLQAVLEEAALSAPNSARADVMRLGRSIVETFEEDMA